MPKHISHVLLALNFLYTLAGCSGGGKSFLPGIPGYDAAQKKQHVLDKELLEISGMFYLPDGRIATINDEDGKIFFFNTTTGDLTIQRFGKKRDYEDIVKAGPYFYILESNGNIHRVPENVEEVEEEFEFSREKKIEFETLYYDASANRLILISKNQREVKDAILAFAFELTGLNFSDTPVYRIDLKKIQAHLKNISAECKPSAAAIHPVLNKLFVVASIGKALVQCSLDGNVEKVYNLNPVQFPQPEGITFAPNGDMFISNEGVNGKGTILEFPYDK